MKEEMVKKEINEIFKSVFGQDNPYTLDEIRDQFAFDIRLPLEVYDSTTGEVTYASTVNSTRFITNKNMMNKDEKDSWMLPKRQVTHLKELLDIWDTINLTTTERVYNSCNVSKSDPIYNSNNVYYCTDCSKDNYIFFSDGINNSDHALASQRSTIINYSIRVDDSNTVTNSYNVICSSNISNSYFIQDCSDLFECIFCSHISNKEYCISNMQFTKEEYYFLKEKIVEWILASN